MAFRKAEREKMVISFPPDWIIFFVPNESILFITGVYPSGIRLYHIHNIQKKVLWTSQEMSLQEKSFSTLSELSNVL
jgi:hypothetical protein